MTSTREIPKEGEIYRHCKGAQYRIIGVTGLPKSEKFEREETFSVSPLAAIHTETGIKVLLISETVDVWTHVAVSQITAWKFDIHSYSYQYIKDLLVVYEKVGTKKLKHLWARPLENFLEVLGDSKSEGGTRYCRFEKVESTNAVQPKLP